MPVTDYIHALTAFPNSKYDAGSLDLEIRSSSIVTAVNNISGDGVNVTVQFKDTLSAEDEAALNSLVAAHSGVSSADPPSPVILKTSSGDDLKDLGGRIRAVMEKSDAASVTVYSHDWTKPQTWLDGAIRVVDEIAVRSNPRKYRLIQENVIDTAHGLITQEDFRLDTEGNSYRVSVKVDGNLKAEDDPHYGGHTGDYHIDYVGGTIHFHEDIDADHDVSVTYHYSTDSHVLIVPAPGKILRLELVEVQFSGNIVLKDTALFQAEGYVAAFAAALIGAPDGTAGVFAVGGATGPGDTLAATDRIGLGAPVVYKSMRDFQNDALKAYPTYPSMGGSSWRGQRTETVVLDWDYVRSKPLSSAAGMRIRVSLEHDEPFEGEYATATFYCGSDDDPNWVAS